jgi:hypothetical protein
MRFLSVRSYTEVRSCLALQLNSTSMTLMTLGRWPYLRGAGLISVLLISGCTNIQLSHEPKTLPKSVHDISSNSGSNEQPNHIAAPVAPLNTLATWATSNRKPAPYSAAVAARFPKPKKLYDTPGLNPGRLNWTSQEELGAWLREQARQSQLTGPYQAAVLTVGYSQEGHPIDALVLTNGSGTDAASVKATERPTVMLFAQQHGDAPASAEALLVIARELAQGELRPLLSRINVLIVPRSNPDGAAKATRLTHNGFDMAHDHLVLETPEAQALVKLARDYQPTVVLDAQEYPSAGAFALKFGALPKADAWVSYATMANLPEFLTKAAEEWYLQTLVSALTAEGLSSEWTHSTSNIEADKTVAWGSLQPDNSANMNGLKNRISLTVASRGADLQRRHSQRRVHTLVTAITSVLNSTAERASELAQLKPYIDQEVIDQACHKDRIIEAHATPTRRTLTLLDPDSGADKRMTLETQSARLLSAVRTRVSPCGYWLEANATLAVERLRLHGVQVMRVTDTAAMLGDFYQTSTPATGALKMNATVSVELLRGVIDAPAGSYYVPLDQALGNLVLVALEPDTPNSYFSQALIDELHSVARVMSRPAANLREVP